MVGFKNRSKVSRVVGPLVFIKNNIGRSWDRNARFAIRNALISD
jgi:hypothetical protein